jgi:hypothetical protein
MQGSVQPPLRSVGHLGALQMCGRLQATALELINCAGTEEHQGPGEQHFVEAQQLSD